MTNNPLMLRTGGGNEPPTSLDDYCARLNAMNFTQASGTEWFVNVRTLENGEQERFVDRRDVSLRREYWKPSEAEIAVTNEVVAECEAKGYTMEHFRSLVNRQIITREVEARLRYQQEAAE